MNSLPPHERYRKKRFVGSSHSWAVAECKKLAVTSRVLDVGSGSGVMGEELATLGFTDIYGVEVDAAAREKTAALYRRMEPSLDPYRGEQFDLILLLDVLEHVPQPQAFLRGLAELLRPGGTLLLSLPNIAHWSVRFQLLFGQFNYTERGILDRTHLTFFTRSSLKRFLAEQSSLEITSRASSIPPLEFVLPEWIWSTALYRHLAKAHLWLAMNLPGLFAYQHLTVLHRK